ncbi:hypothetical protein J5N97_009721 [Dioscorea zingiberensis]|uniref:PWWP domain-containing protein n=1 Tax=Dioscorea zingiberensis TaxID=325984 RepID=A0A9D5HM62_9LILI|nr:hypothetical protein J5N97_009721 [Dioscorea zingiberensis]
MQNQFDNDNCEANQCFVCQVGNHTRAGDTLWTKVNGCSWWPAQVVSEKSISNKHKRKAEDEVLFPNLVVTINEVLPIFILDRYSSKKITIIGKPFRKPLRRVLTAFINSKIQRRKTFESAMGKRRKHNVVEGSHKTDSPASPEAHTDNLKELKSVREERGKNKAEAIRDNNSRRYDLRKTKEREQKIDTMDKDHKSTKDIAWVKSGGSASTAKENNASKASRGKEPKKIRNDYDDADGLVTTRTHSGKGKESSAMQNKRERSFQEKKTKIDEAKKRRTTKASEDHIKKEASDSKMLKLGKRVSNRSFDAKTAMQDEVKLAVKEKSRAKIYNGTGSPKSKIGAAGMKSSKQNGSSPSKCPKTKEILRTNSPIYVNREVTEPVDESVSTSVRKMKVMQSLGLIAPSGSPFERNLFTKGLPRIY